jgi:hypothetical protein
MRRPATLLSLVCLSLLPQPVLAESAYDPMEDLVSSAKQEINARDTIDTQKNRVQNDPRRKQVERGFWQFFQASRGAKPGEFCTAVFWKNDRMISITGPCGGYKGAFLSFVAIDPKPPFPRPDKPGSIDKVKVTLKQGNDAPTTITALNRTLEGFSDEIRFAVPTIDAALAGIEDTLAFRIDYQGQEIFALAWHAGFAARDMLKRCLAGQKVDGNEVP